jgi:hypothetical protein
MATMPRALNCHDVSDAHKNRVKGCYFESRSDFISERFLPNALAAFACSSGIPGLDHEPFDVAVKEAAIIVVGSAERKEVLLKKLHK